MNGKNGNEEIFIVCRHYAAGIERARHEIALAEHNALACSRSAGGEENGTHFVHIRLVIFRRADVFLFVCGSACFIEVLKTHEALGKLLFRAVEGNEIFYLREHILYGKHLGMERMGIENYLYIAHIAESDKLLIQDILIKRNNNAAANLPRQYMKLCSRGGYRL